MGNKIACCSKNNGEFDDLEGQNIPKIRRKSFNHEYNDYSKIKRSGKLALEKEKSIEN